MSHQQLQRIRIDIENARSCANKLRTVAEECMQTGRTVQSAYSEIPGYWQGQSADAFSQELQGWISENQLVQGEIEALSDMLLRLAQEFEAAEERIKAEIAADNATQNSAVI